MDPQKSNTHFQNDWPVVVKIFFILSLATRFGRMKMNKRKRKTVFFVFVFDGMN